MLVAWSICWFNALSKVNSICNCLACVAIMTLILAMITLSLVYMCNSPYATSGIYGGFETSLIVPTNVSVQAPGVFRDTFVVEKGGRI